VAYRNSHKPFQTTRKLSTLNDCEESLRTLCQLCGIVAKQYVLRVAGGSVGYGDDEFLYRLSIVTMYLSAAVWTQFWMQMLLPAANHPRVPNNSIVSYRWL